MTQLSIDDIEETSKRLVKKDYMHTLEWNVYNELKSHLTKENAIKASELAQLFDIDTRTLREIIATLRSKQYAKIIGDNNGYYIGTVDEFNEWIGARLKRTLTSIGTTLDLNPDKKKIIYWFLNEYYRESVAQGQQKMQFNDWDSEFIRQFAEDYKKE